MSDLDIPLETQLTIVRASAPRAIGRIPGLAQTLEVDSAALESEIGLQPRESSSAPPRHRVSTNASVVHSRPSRSRGVSAPDGISFASHSRTDAQDVNDAAHDQAQAIVNARLASQSMPTDFGELEGIEVHHDRSRVVDLHVHRDATPSDVGTDAVSDSSQRLSHVSTSDPSSTLSSPATIPLLASNAPMRRIMQDPALLDQVMYPSNPSNLQIARRMVVRVVIRARKHTRLVNGWDRLQTTRSSHWSAWLAAWYMLLRVSEEAAQLLNSALAYITVIGVDYRIFDFLSLEEILDCLPSLKQITFKDSVTADLVEIDVLRKGDSSEEQPHHVSQDTLLVSDSSFPAGTLQEIMTRETHLPTPWPIGWRYVSRSACNLEGNLGLALGINVDDMPLSDRMSEIQTSQAWPFKDLCDRIEYCSQGRRLPWDLYIYNARFDLQAYTRDQLEKLFDLAWDSHIGRDSLTIVMWNAIPSSCSVFAFLERDFWAQYVINMQSITVSVLAADDAATAKRIKQWEPMTIDGPPVHNEQCALVFLVILPSGCTDPSATYKAGGRMPDNHSNPDDRWIATHWLIVDWLVRAVQCPDQVTIAYVTANNEEYDRTMKSLRHHFQRWWRSLPDRHLRYDERHEQWKDFSRPRLVCYPERARLLLPYIVDRLCLWCAIAMAVDPGKVSLRCYADCANLVEGYLHPNASTTGRE